MTDFDPYAVLGVEKTATAEQVKAAARKIYRKTHPDLAGGNGEAFSRARRAEQILLDEESRRTFDTTGKVNDQRADNKRARAIEVVLRTFDGALAAHINGMLDLRKCDMPKQMAESIKSQVPDIERQIEKAEHDRELLRDIAKRLKYDKDGDDPISAALRQKIQGVEAGLVQLKDSITAMNDAVKLLGGYSFKFDQAGEMMRLLGNNIVGWAHTT